VRQKLKLMPKDLKKPKEMQKVIRKH